MGDPGLGQPRSTRRAQDASESPKSSQSQAVRREKKHSPSWGKSLFAFLFGRRLKTIESETQRVGPIQGVPILGLDAIGSSFYGPEAALTVLAPLGVISLWYSREIILASLLLLGILYFSYRQTVAAHPGGGGSYTVANENPGRRAGLYAAALLFDYILNVAVAISARSVPWNPPSRRSRSIPWRCALSSF
jgi:hypothetical protein